MVQDGADVLRWPGRLDQVGVEFDDRRLISDAGLLLTATLAERLGLEELVNEKSVWLPYGTPGAALPAIKVLYPAIHNRVPQWTRTRGWTKAMLAFKIQFGNRIPS